MQGHLAKAGTPTLGGLVFVPVAAAVALRAAPGSPRVAACCAAALACGSVGLLDDLLVLRRRSNRGLAGRAKLALQVLVGAGLVAWLAAEGRLGALGAAQVRLRVRCGAESLVRWPGRPETDSRLRRPPKPGPGVPGAVYGALGVFTVAAEANGVNLTDGLDGLAAGTGACAFAGLGLASAAAGSADLAALCLAFAGALCGFLRCVPEARPNLNAREEPRDHVRFHSPSLPRAPELLSLLTPASVPCPGRSLNRHPARVFMGDTGALAVGGALAAVGVVSGGLGPLLLASLVFAAEAGSALLQVAYFRRTKRRHGEGRRLFRMAPLHHHFELGGLPEVQVVHRFWAAGAACAGAAYGAAVLA